MPISSPTAARALAIACMLIGTAFALRAEINAPAKPPPQPVAVEVEVPRGESVRIPLRIFGASREQVNFQVRLRPSWGKLSKIEPATTEVSHIVYTHSGTFSETTDTFTYSSKTSLGVSAPARVNIRVLDKPSILVVPDKIEFSPTVVGRDSTRTFTLVNLGGGLATGVIAVERPWQVEDQPLYRLGPQERAEFTLRFHSEKAGDFRATMRYSSDATRQTVLWAKATAPFTVEPLEVKFTQVPESAARKASIAVSNNLEHEIEVEVLGEEFASQPRKFTLAAEASQTVKFSIPADDVEAISADIRIRSEDYTAIVPAEAPAPGPVLTLEPEALDFGTVQPGDKISEPVRIANLGGERAFVEMRVDAPFSVSKADATFTLEPGETRGVSVFLGTDRPGRFRFPATIKTYAGTKELLLAGAVAGPDAAPGGYAVATPIPLREGRAASAPTPAQHFALPKIRDIVMAKTGRREIRLTWKPPAPGRLTYQVEQQLTGIGPDKQIAKKWIQASDTVTGTLKGLGFARFHNLEPGRLYRVRVSARAANGDQSPPSELIQMQTAVPFRFPLGLRTALILAMIVLVALVILQRRRASADEKL